MQSKKRKLSGRELATMLAALRYWQDEMLSLAAEHPIASESGKPLDHQEINILCEDLNTTESIWIPA